MDYRKLAAVPDSFYAETRKLYDQNQTDFFFASHGFEHEGTEYSVSASKKDIDNLIKQLSRIPQNATDDYISNLDTYYESSKLIDEICRKYPNDQPTLEWNDDYKRIPGYLISWQHTDHPENALVIKLKEGTLKTKPLIADEYHKAHYIILEMIRRIMADPKTQQRLIPYLTDENGILKSNTIYTFPFVDNRLNLQKLYLTVKKYNVLWLSYKWANKELNYPNYKETADELANRTDLFD